VKIKIARLYRLIGDTESSISIMRHLLADTNSQENPWIRLSMLWGLSTSLRDTWQLEESYEVGKQLLKLSQDLDSESDQILSLIYILGWVSSYQNKHEEALEFINRAFLLSKEQIFQEHLFDVYGHGFGLIYWRAKKFSEAAHYFQLLNKEMDYEYRIHLGVGLFIAILWAEHIGIYTTNNYIALKLSDFFGIATP
jgi:hypothetical protein